MLNNKIKHKCPSMACYITPDLLMKQFFALVMNAYEISELVALTRTVENAMLP